MRIHVQRHTMYCYNVYSEKNCQPDIRYCSKCIFKVILQVVTSVRWEWGQRLRRSSIHLFTTHTLTASISVQALLHMIGLVLVKWKGWEEEGERAEGRGQSDSGYSKTTCTICSHEHKKSFRLPNV